MPTRSDTLWAVDTNILVYATAPDAPPEKQRIATQLLGHLFTSDQRVPSMASENFTQETPGR